MSSIGGFGFIRMEGPDVPMLAAAVAIIDRPGVNGTANRVDALKAEEITVYTKEAVTQLSTANAAADDYAALKGSYVTVVDDMGRGVYDVLVVDVRVLGKQAFLLSDPPDLNYIVRAVWLLKPTL
ncbi:MAG: hypothetical protein ACYSSI_10150 [Planctomycetota bacterium]|jgi:hypothetical protein